MPPLIQGFTVRQLIYGTYTFFRGRVENAERDSVKVLQIQKVSVYDGLAPGEARTKYVIRSQSNPQYYPYYQPKDTRGRPHKAQRTTYHQYDVVIQMDKMHVDSPIRFRTGADCRWIFGPKARAQWAPRPKGASRDRQRRLLREDVNVARGRNGDFFFRLEYVLWNAGNLFGRNWTNGPPNQTNPQQIPFFDKHAWTVIQYLIMKGHIQK